ncbi:histidine phosphatase family protein [Kyrpidia tusciae]|uniref:Phosphoglycerate mutase n=1 Tax=Kyrpidia tusciae (strain DSM 2912 / NBRC 15312 / T2) TaxID=562970 RepID=D5WV65_KYRT2|nr:histidine phosphatase family protein [Kyrpidia tusciae]ADG05475.1 Phosphoglycerate mutase [Kyrpidia tusciae DSM 2912]
MPETEGPVAFTQICLVRHGETTWNREQRLQGHRDVPLTDVGRRQAEAVARRLAEGHWDAVYSSDLMRARYTAEVIAKACGIHFVTDPRLRERSYGQLEGLTRTEIAQRYPHLAGHSWEHEDSGVEPWERMADRAQAALADMTARHKGSRLIVVSHGGWIRALLGRLFPNWDLKSPIDNTSITVLRQERDTWRLVVANDTSHLVEPRISQGDVV